MPFQNKILKNSLFLLLLGVVFLLLENIFFQYVDAQGWLHESLFMPLGVFSLMAGITGIVIYFVLFGLSLIKHRTK
ncbi:MAG: DUF3955 domain-containing protein [Candidatus Thioglobus sp.]|uniref:DUF3955 domain-containing protein n=1 Tax=Candidatus Thioglobus sp. TaxID=2026721 RepID=UPI0026377F3A|nr:DUF3955 domain-containing protein [Candidatus Thioglobus sp.]MDC9727539.1 DUF3955 domain-containing protein [Candidatus Thioglobus sp.]